MWVGASRLRWKRAVLYGKSGNFNAAGNCGFYVGRGSREIYRGSPEQTPLFYPKVALIYPSTTFLRCCSGAAQEIIREIAKHGFKQVGSTLRCVWQLFAGPQVLGHTGPKLGPPPTPCLLFFFPSPHSQNSPTSPTSTIVHIPFIRLMLMVRLLGHLEDGDGLRSVLAPKAWPDELALGSQARLIKV